MIALLTLLIFLGPPATQWTCDDEHGPARSYSDEDVVAAFDRADDVARERGASKSIQAALRAVGMRESSGRWGVWHRRGGNERGLGMHGLSIRWHGHRVPAGESLCDPATSARAVLQIWRSAIRRFKARTLLDLQRVFAGRFREVGHPPTHRLDVAWCTRLRGHGVHCSAPVRIRDVGE